MKKGLFFLLSFLIIGCEEEKQDYKPPTKELTQITYSLGMNITPSLFSERYLAFSSNVSSNFDIYIKDLQENTLIQRTQTKEDELFPAFSSDGQKIAFSSKRFGSFDIFIIPAFKSGNIEQVTFDNSSDEISPDFSTDGKHLVFSRVRWGEPPIISIVNLKNGMITDLTTGLYPKFSPRQDKIVFQRDGKICLYDLKTHLTKEVVQYEGLSCISPSFSPDGKRIVYSTGDKEERKSKFLDLISHTPIDIRVINIGGTRDIRLTDDLGPDGFPVWSQDNYIYFCSLRNGKDNSNINIFRLNFEE